MDIKKILEMKNTSERDRLGMILSNRIDCFFPKLDAGAVSVKRFEELADDLLKWRDACAGATEWECIAKLLADTMHFGDKFKIIGEGSMDTIERARRCINTDV